jgi:hypothetical protein
VKFWLLLSLPLAAVGAVAGQYFRWSSTTVVFLVAASSAYFMFPPMIVALSQWNQTPVDPVDSVDPVPESPWLPAKQNEESALQPPGVVVGPALSGTGIGVRWEPALTSVLLVLADHLPDSEDRDSVRDLATVRAGHVAVARGPQNAWQALLTAALDQGKLDAVLDAAADRNRTVAAQVRNYRENS